MSDRALAVASILVSVLLIFAIVSVLRGLLDGASDDVDACVQAHIRDTNPGTVIDFTEEPGIRISSGTPGPTINISPGTPGPAVEINSREYITISNSLGNSVTVERGGK